MKLLIAISYRFRCLSKHKHSRGLHVVRLTLGVFIAFVVTVISSANDSTIFHAQGELAGEVLPDSALLQSRLTAISGPATDDQGDIPGISGIACFEWSEMPDFKVSRRTEWLKSRPESDFIVRTRIKDLKPGTKYYYRLIYGKDADNPSVGPSRSFITPGGNRMVSFCMGSCMNYHAFQYGKPNGGGPVTATPEDKMLGYPAFAAMTNLKPDFFVGTGDIVYYDYPSSTAARTLPELRRKWHEQFRFPRMIHFFANTATYWSKDDHDFRYNDADLAGSKLPNPTTGIDLFREQMPILDSADRLSPTYRTIRFQKHLQLWFVEGRDFRSPNSMPDGPDKSIWGLEQRNWLQTTIKASDATWKLIITPTPMVGPDRNSKMDNHTNLRGFKHEADQFFEWLRDEKILNVITLCGDRHWQYHSIHPLGVEEFSVGALNDENSIRGEKPGTARSTDPEGKILQPYLYSEPTGGFLHVTVDPEGTLVLRHYDDQGEILNTVEKTPPVIGLPKHDF